MIERSIELLKVVFLGIVEGITEWLPISSTGHMLLVDEFLQMNASESFKEMFFVVIQLGAILAVVLLFWEKMWPFQRKTATQSPVRWETIQLWLKVVVACVPGAVVTLLFDDYIEAHLHTPTVIAAALSVYGVGFLVIENWNKTRTLRLHHHRGPDPGGVQGGGGGVHLLPGGAGDVWVELFEAAEIRVCLHRHRAGHPGRGLPGGLPGLGGGD